MNRKSQSVKGVLRFLEVKAKKQVKYGQRGIEKNNVEQEGLKLNNTGKNSQMSNYSIISYFTVKTYMTTPMCNGF